MPLPKPGSFPHPDVQIVSPGYEKVLGVHLLSGRGFEDTDRENAPSVAMVNATLAQRLFPDTNPVGKRFVLGRLGPRDGRGWITIVGLLADTKMYGLGNPSRLEIYVPFRQVPSNEMTLLVKSSRQSAALVPTIRAVIGSIDKEQPVFAIAAMQDVVDASIFTRLVTLILLELFGALALVLASIGIYGVVSYLVVQRAREIGIRIALGAQRDQVLRRVFAHGWKISFAGLVIGSGASLALTHLLGKLLYSVSALDPAIFAAASVVLALVSMLACHVPARRALNVDPLIALRHE